MKYCKCGQIFPERKKRLKSFCYNSKCILYGHYAYRKDGKCRWCGNKLRVINNKLQRELIMKKIKR